MMPRNFSTRVLTLCVVILLVLSIHFSRSAAAVQTGSFGYCASGPEQSTVYVSEIFTGPNLDVAPDSNPIQNEYNEYLRGRFDFKSNSSFSVHCPLFFTTSEAQSSKQAYEMQMRHGNKQIVEVEWAYRPGPAEIVVSVPRPQHSATGVAIAQADRTFCVSDAYQNTVYFTGPVLTPPPVSMSYWINGFTQFLNGKYSFQGRVYCNMGNAEIARRLVNAHLEGSRAAGRTVVETNWKYDATQATNTSPSRPSEPDEDRQPAQRPAAQTPNLQARDYVLKETPRVTAYCVSDRLMASAFDCDCLRRQISRYRLDHVSDTLSASPTPLEELFKGDKFDCKSCIQVEWKFKTAVRSFARSDCAIEKFRALLTARPYPSQSKELLNEAIQSCR
jgi:hypothetical protein